MTNFEQCLINKGYKRYRYNVKTKEYEIAKSYLLSSLGTLEYHYINDSGKHIIFGLSELNKPPTLISPRPNIKVYKTINGIDGVLTNHSDDAMNIVLMNTDYDDIYKAMFDSNLVIKIKE